MDRQLLELACWLVVVLRRELPQLALRQGLRLRVLQQLVQQERQRGRRPGRQQVQEQRGVRRLEHLQERKDRRLRGLEQELQLELQRRALRQEQLELALLELRTRERRLQRDRRLLGQALELVRKDLQLLELVRVLRGLAPRVRGPVQVQQGQRLERRDRRQLVPEQERELQGLVLALELEPLVRASVPELAQVWGCRTDRPNLLQEEQALGQELVLALEPDQLAVLALGLALAQAQESGLVLV